ncbi:MAG: hypothetical protein DRH30_03215 [Deltaproteobacteria bacterium]|nr:MAG: hypothetical protein DRH30_03215 [Deltaproteobacteria bacterium]
MIIMHCLVYNRAMKMRHIHIRVPEEMYQRMQRASEESEVGDSVSDVARAGILRELKTREKRSVKK